jgi:hypothetical protein
MEKTFQANRDQKQARVVILTPDKADFKTKPVRKDKGHLILIKGQFIKRL